MYVGLQTPLESSRKFHISRVFLNYNMIRYRGLLTAGISSQSHVRGKIGKRFGLGFDGFNRDLDPPEKVVKE